MAPGPAIATSPGNLLEMQILRPHPRSLEPEALELQPRKRSPSPAGDADAHSSLRCTVLDNHFQDTAQSNRQIHKRFSVFNNKNNVWMYILLWKLQGIFKYINLIWYLNVIVKCTGVTPTFYFPRWNWVFERVSKFLNFTKLVNRRIRLEPRSSGSTRVLLLRQS